MSVQRWELQLRVFCCNSNHRSFQLDFLPTDRLSPRGRFHIQAFFSTRLVILTGQVDGQITGQTRKIHDSKNWGGRYVGS